MVRDLETKLKNERSELGHRVLFGVGRKGEVPAPTEADRGRVLGVDGWFTVTGSGGGGSSTPDGHTLAQVTGVLNAEPLSGTVDARFKDLSGSLTGKFATIGGGSGTPDGATLASVTGVLNAIPLSGTINASFLRIWGAGGVPRPGDVSGSIDGHFNALSGTVNSAIISLSGTINSTLQAVFSASQVWSQTTNGTEGTVMTAVIPVPYAGPQYYAFITNTTGSNSPVYRIQNKNSASFQVVSTAPFSNGDRVDFLTISGGLGPVWDGSVIASLSGTIDARFFNLSGTIDARFNSLGGGYRGAWATATTYTVGSMVRRGPFVFGAVSGTTQDPCVVEGDLGSSTDWQVRGNASQSGSTMILHTGLAQNSLGIRRSTNSGWHGRRLIVDALVGPAGAADYFSFGIIDGGIGTGSSPGSPGGMAGVSAAWGVNVDFGSNRVGSIANGTASNYNTYSAVAVGNGNDILETSVYYRYYLDLVQSGSNMNISLYRDSFIWSSTDTYQPGLVGQWSVTAPAYTTWRFIVGSTQGGGSAANVRVSAAWTQYKPNYGEWDLINEFPHTPRIDHRIF